MSTTHGAARLVNLIDLSSESPLQRAYREIYEGINSVDLTEQIQLDETLEQKARRDQRMIGNVAGLRVLEIGPGLGHLSRRLQAAGAEVSLADLAPGYIERLADTVDGALYVCDITDPRLAIGTEFDLVIMCDVLEHLLRPYDALFNARKLLRPGGRLYVRCPANEPLYSYAMSLGCPYELVHVRTYTKSTLRRELRSTGFKIERGPTSFRGLPRSARNTPLASVGYWESRHHQARSVYAHSTEPARSTIQRFRDAVLSGARPVDGGRARSSAYPLTRALSMLLAAPGELVVLARKP